MRKAENVNAPWLGGWMIGAAAGLVAFGALVVVGKFELTPAAAIGVVVALLVGLILGMPWGAGRSAGAMPKPETPARAAEPRAAEAMPAIHLPVKSANVRGLLQQGRETHPSDYPRFGYSAEPLETLVARAVLESQ